MKGMPKAKPLHADSVQGKDASYHVWLYDGVTALLLFFLLWEWLRPLVDIAHWTDLYLAAPVLVAMAVFIVLDYVRCPSLFGWLLKLGVCVVVVVHYYSPGTWTDAEAWVSYYTVWQEDVEWLASGRHVFLSAENRTLLLLAGWGLMIHALYRLLLYRQAAWWLIGLTIVYLLLMEVWGGVDTGMAVVRTVVLGLVLLAVVGVSRLERVFRIAGRGSLARWPRRWLVGSGIATVMVLALGWLGYALEDRTWRHVDGYSPFGYFGGFPSVSAEVTTGPSRAAARTGYGDDDSKLGGDLQKDDSVAFTAITERLGYWRGEIKTFYTGQGWTGGDGEADRVVVFAPETMLKDRTSDMIAVDALPNDRMSEMISEDALPNDRGSDTFTQEIMPNDPRIAGMLFASGRIEGVKAMLSKDGTWLSADSIHYDALRDKYSLQGGMADFYELEVTDIGGTGPLNEAELERYLQLPDSVPERVLSLADEWVSVADSDLDKAERIAARLRDDYTYSMSGLPALKEGEDFVDMFLFEHRTGYCDYFSTAMVVLLRASGIPARWVKGFASGQVQEADATETRWTVAVRNSDAHSWVEAFIPGQGWTTFEPTPGIVAASDVQGAAMVAEGERISTFTAISSLNLAQGGQWLHAAVIATMRVGGTKIAEQVDGLFDERWQFSVGGRHFYAAHIALVALALSLAGLALCAYRWLSASRRAIGGERPRRSAAASPQAAEHERYLRKVMRKYGAIRAGQTLREYVEQLSEPDPNKKEALAQLCHLYEHAVYDRKGKVRASRSKLEHLWKTVRGRRTQG